MRIEGFFLNPHWWTFVPGGQISAGDASRWRAAQRHFQSFPSRNEERSIGRKQCCRGGQDASNTRPVHSRWIRFKKTPFFSPCFWMFSQQTLWTRSLSTLAAEKGQFLALDLGGSRFKVLCVKVREGKGVRRGRVEMQEKIFPIPPELLEGKGAEVRRWHENGGGEAERQ